VQSTFEEAKDTCQQEGMELVRDLGYLMAFGKRITTEMLNKNMDSAWIGKQLFPFKYGML